MKSAPIRLALAGLAMLVLGAAAVAAASPEPSSPTAPATGAMELLAGGAPDAIALQDPGAPLTLALAQMPASFVHAGSAVPVEFAGVHYEKLPDSWIYKKPKTAKAASKPDSNSTSTNRQGPTGMSQIHVGYFDPDNQLGSRMQVGIRGGPMLTRNLQLGLSVDWIHRTNHISSLDSTSTGLGGVPVTVRNEVARSSMNMFPVMGFLQLSAPDNLGIVPYIGGGGGYQVMILSTDDFVTVNHAQTTYAGWGWQAWAGLGISAGGHIRLFGEGYKSEFELGREVTDAVTGLPVRETVNANGMGARFGLMWGF
jgi:hypothetical protein